MAMLIDNIIQPDALETILNEVNGRANPITVNVNKVNSERDYEILDKIYNTEWDPENVQPNSSGIIKKRIEKGALFFIAYAEVDDSIQNLFKKRYNIDINTGEFVPVGLLETAPAETRGDYSKIPGTYLDLMGVFGKTPTKNDDTIIFADVTTHVTNRRISSTLVDFAVKYISLATNYTHIWTYTPNNNDLITWHQHRGAEPIDIEPLKNARPDYRIKDVAPMSYDNKMLDFLEKAYDLFDICHIGPSMVGESPFKEQKTLWTYILTNLEKK